MALAALLLIGGGSFAYLRSTTEEKVNEFQTNKVVATLEETTGSNYKIIPGTSEKKDPTVYVDNTVDAYVFVEVTDKTQGLVHYEIADGWQKLAEAENVYYQVVKAGGTGENGLAVLKNNTVTYDKALENSDMLDSDGKLKAGVTLTFNAYAIQVSGFENDIAGAYNIANGKWDGTSASKEELEAAVDKVNQTVSVSTPQLLSALADDITSGTSYAGYTISLDSDLDMNGQPWTAIQAPGSGGENGQLDGVTIDGNGHTIKNLNPVATVSGYDYKPNVFNNAFIGYFVGDLTIKNITFDGAYVHPDYDKVSNVNITGVILSSVPCSATFENVTVQNSTVEGYGKVGAFMGSGCESTCNITFKNCKSLNNTLIGSYNLGGLSGLMIKDANGRDNGTVENCVVEGITYKTDSASNYINLDGYTAQFTDNNLKTGNEYSQNLSGLYWEYIYIDQYDNKSYYFYGATAEYYVAYGNSSYDAPINEEINGKSPAYVADSEINVGSNNYNTIRR